MRNSVIGKIVLVFGSILISLYIAELFLCIIHPTPTKYYIWQPNLHYTFHPDSTIFYDIHGAKNFDINSQGFRGDEFNPETKNILCLGGSSTECLYLDNEETWEKRLQQILNQHSVKSRFVIGNVGKSGCSTREHYIQLKYAIPQLGKVDGVIMMVGLNDLMKRLSRDTLFENDFQFTREVEDSFVKTIFLSNKSEEKTWWRKTELFQLLQRAYHRNKPNGVEWQIQDDRGEIYRNWRENRKHVIRIIDSLPNLQSALNEYKRNLNLLIDEAQRQKINIIFINQTALYKDTMNEYETNLLWMGGIGNFQSGSGHPYYSPHVLKKAIEMYNLKLAEACSTRKVQLIDIASSLARDTSVFYDDCHFHETGARKVAKIIARQW